MGKIKASKMNKRLTVHQAAEFASVTPWQIRQYINTGLLKAHRLGEEKRRGESRRQWRIYLEDLIEFINGRG